MNSAVVLCFSPHHFDLHPQALENLQISIRLLGMLGEKIIICRWKMSSLDNLSKLRSSVMHTLCRGSMTERLLVGSFLGVAGILIAEKIYKWAVRLLTKPQQGSSLASRTLTINPKIIEDYKKRLQKEVRPPSAVDPILPKDPPAAPPASQTHSLLQSLSIRDQLMTAEQEPLLAQALHAYQALKTEVDGVEDRFVFLAESYCASQQLPEKLKWEEKKVELDIPPHFNAAFKALGDLLKRVGLKLEDVRDSDQPLGEAHFKDGSSRKLSNLSDLYQTVKLQGPHILSPLEIDLKKKRIGKAKATLHNSRLEIIDKALSTLRAVLIDRFLKSFPEKHQDLYALVENKPEALRFVVENICWHALDIALESIETTFVPTEEKQHKHQQLELTNLLKRGLPEADQQKQAESFLLEILKDPHNTQAIESLVQLLITERGMNPDREALIKRVQEPQLQLEEERVEQELGRLEMIQKFFTAVLFAVGVVDQGKAALQIKQEERAQKKVIIARPILPQLQAPPHSLQADQKTYAQEIEQVSQTVAQAGERAIKNIARERLQAAFHSIESQVKQLPGISEQMLPELVEKGWTHFPDKQRTSEMTRQQRWLVTQAMICQRLARASLEKKGDLLIHEVGKWASSFVETVYGRLIIALLSFERRTLEVDLQDAKPADRIAEAFIDPLVKSYQALQKVKKRKPEAGKRESEIVKELDRNKDMHPSVSNKQHADAIFLGKLILDLLPVLQPEGLLGDIQKILDHDLNQSGELGPTFLQKMIEKYKTSILPGAEPWVQPVWNFLIQAFQNIIEKQSAYNIADQMSDWLSPVTINSYLVDFLMNDKSEIELHELSPGAHKNDLKWYNEDETHLEKLLTDRAVLKKEIEACEEQLLSLKKEQKSDESINKELVEKKCEAFELDTTIAPRLLRRILIANSSPTFAGYVLQFADDLFELLQYPRVVRNIVFQVLEKSVQSLVHPLEEGQAPVNLDLPINPETGQSFFDFLFSNTLKANFGSTLLNLISSVSTQSWTGWGFLGQTVARTVVPGHFVFSTLQGKIEDLIKKKFNDSQAIEWSVAKLVLTLDAKMIQFANDSNDQWMTAVLTTQLNKALGDQH